MAATTIIFGGSGKVARHLTRLLASQEGQTVYSVIRKAEQVPEIESLGGKPLVRSIEDASVDDMAATISEAKATTVVWSAGAGGKGGPERTQTVDRDGAIKSMDATARAGVKRYIMVSAIDVRDRENKPQPEWYEEQDVERSNKGWGALGRYMQAKLEADRNLVVENSRRKLEYTIVRPTSLTEDAGTGKIAAGRVRTTTPISREDVAAAIVECIKNDGTKGLAIDMVGGEVSIAKAIAEVAEQRIDTFEGYY